MHRKLILSVMLALLLGATGASLAFGGQTPGDSHKQPVMLVTLTHTNQTDFDLGAPGPSVGDRFIVFGDAVRSGAPGGTGGYECVTMLFRPGPSPTAEPAALTDQCSATLSLPEGQITAQGLVNRAGPIPVTIAITGGTGAYRAAHGEIETSGPNQAGDEPLTVRLILGND
jgi:hypothetical protein